MTPSSTSPRAVLSNRWLVPLGLLLICIIGYAPLITSLGLYWDDWPSLWFLHFFGPGIFPQAFAADRPVQGWLFSLTTRLVGELLLAWHIFGIIARWLSGLALYGLLASLWPERKLPGALGVDAFPALPRLYAAIYPHHLRAPVPDHVDLLSVARPDGLVDPQAADILVSDRPFVVDRHPDHVLPGILLRIGAVAPGIPVAVSRSDLRFRQSSMDYFQALAALRSHRSGFLVLAPDPRHPARRGDPVQEIGCRPGAHPFYTNQNHFERHLRISGRRLGSHVRLSQLQRAQAQPCPGLCRGRHRSRVSRFPAVLTDPEKVRC